MTESDVVGLSPDRPFENAREPVDGLLVGIVAVSDRYPRSGRDVAFEYLTSRVVVPCHELLDGVREMLLGDVVIAGLSAKRIGPL